MPRWVYPVLILVVALAALLVRLPEMGKRPMHTDEAVHAEKFNELWTKGVFVYDPHEYHGPTLHFASWPGVWGTGTKSFAQTTEGTFRVVPVLFCVLTIVLLIWMGDGLGRPAAVVAAVLLAISPAFVFYSKYYIQEVLLICFTQLALVGGYGLTVSPRWRWALLGGVGLGLMHATKETWVIAGAGMAFGGVMSVWWTKLFDRISPLPPVRVRWQPLAVGGIIGGLVAFVLLSSFFRNMRGPVDSILTYATYLGRGAGKSTDHVHPFDQYLKWFFWYPYQYKGKFVYTELFIAILAAVGAVRALWPHRAVTADGLVLRGNMFHRFLVFYTVFVLFVYSRIAYKTPWCGLGFLHGMILLAGVGAVSIVRLVPVRWWVARVPVALALCVPAWELGRQSYRMNYVLPFEHRVNPHVYGATAPAFKRMVEQLDQITAAWPEGKDTPIVIATADAWPLPWYLRSYRKVEYSDKPNASDVGVPLLVFQSVPGIDLDPTVSAALDEKYQTEAYGLRRGVILALCIRRDVWDTFIARRSAAK